MNPAWRRSTLALLSLCAGLLCTSEVSFAAQTQPDPAAVAFFESKVRPLFHEHCVKCHGPEKQKGSLRLDSPAGILTGGKSGPLLVPGEPEKSLILKAVSYQDEQLQMPPKQPLPPEAVEVLQRWVTQGAAMPEAAAGAVGAIATKGYDWETWNRFWSVQPVKRPDVPAVKDTAWPRYDMDRFILAQLEAKGLKPAPSADKRTLIRRATFDLLGLPPTFEEIKAFLADNSPDAYDKLIDRLLASPHYGERWGRHWLDIARHVQGRITFPGFDRIRSDEQYRDYVVRALNKDKPYNQFILEQIAGDLLPDAADREQQMDQIAAPAFLSIGAWFEQCTDPNRLRMEIIDDQIDVIGRGVLGLTLTCARCHDHKFDPIPTEDYYALAGIMGSTQVLGHFNENWRDGRTRLLRPLAMPAQLQERDAILQQMRSTRAELDALLLREHTAKLTAWKSQEAAYRAAAQALPAIEAVHIPAASFHGLSNLKLAESQGEQGTREILESRIAEKQWVRYRFEVAREGEYAVEVCYSSNEPMSLPVRINSKLSQQQANFEDTGGWGLERQRIRTVGTWTLQAGSNSIQLEREQGSFPRLQWLRVVARDPQQIAAVKQTAEAQSLDPRVLQRFAERAPEPWPQAGDVQPYLDEPAATQAASLAAKIEALRAKLPEFDLAISLADEPVPADMPVHTGGQVYQTREAAVPRSMLRWTDAALPRPAIPSNTSGRLQLAQWLTDDKHPLTARVMANRLWHWHFGRGIVRTTSDFGSRGEQPTHPLLLDHLASEFVARGWSLKAMHKLIMTSSTYRMSSQYDEASAAADPEGIWLWRYPRRRLEAEAIYDAMLVAANRHPRQPAGALDVSKSKDRAMYVLTSGRSPKGLGPEVRKMFPLFDYDDTGVILSERKVSTTPAQSLFWLNNGVPQHFAQLMAQRLMGMTSLDEAGRVTRGYELTLGRLPTPGEKAAALDFLRAAKQEDQLAEAEAWARWCQSLFASAEFRWLE